MAKHQLIRAFILKLLLDEKREFSYNEIYDKCKKKYSRSTSTVVLNNILSKNKDIIKTGCEKTLRVTYGYQLSSKWIHRENLKEILKVSE